MGAKRFAFGTNPWPDWKRCATRRPLKAKKRCGFFGLLLLVIRVSHLGNRIFKNFFFIYLRVVFAYKLKYLIATFLVSG